MGEFTWTLVRYFLAENIFCFTDPRNFEIMATGSLAHDN